MAQRPTHVPKFGNWTEDHIPYTAVFNNARAGKGTGGKMINPNDPEENPTAFVQNTEIKDNTSENLLGKNLEYEDGSVPGRPPPPPRRTSDSNLNGGQATKPRHERRYSREDVDSRRPIGSPARFQYADSPARKTTGESPGHRYGGRNTTAGGSVKSNTGESQRGDQGMGEVISSSQDQSPAQYQGRLGNKPGAASPAWDRKGSVDGGPVFAPATPGRKPRGGSARADETPDRGGPLPKFGAWNENDPASADGFTFIFNKAREEKLTGGASKIPTMPPETPSRDSGYKKTVPRKNSFPCCCLPQTAE